ncbi:glycosyltransferase [Aliiroseovarius sp.]|uniref:glycosyltransferase n=1 Tax=Aliiroseovarius sp. TaxID=1872442 RepID=UPI00260442A0|nr:glycosyltransferase [Aliiroseovarius sp.]
MTAPPQSISVIVPAYNAAHLLPDVLAPLLAMQKSGEVAEVLVIDDCSPDDTAQVARDLGARVLATPQNGGPGAARNLAAATAVGDILWLVDSDVIAREGGGAIIRRAFEEPDVKAVFGSYDDAPAGTPWFSRYKNLMHRFYHQRANREAQTFWAGCGAIDREMFLKVGGFDVETYAVPSIEDIELGYRIRNAGGRILLLPDLEAKHLKVWTIRNAMFTDIFRRALPWSRLMISREGLTNDLNTGWAERVKAVVALALLLQPAILLIRPDLWPLAVLIALLALFMNGAFARFLFRKGGLRLAVGGMLYHQVYYVYSATAYVWCLFEYHVLRRRNRLHVP